MSQRRLRACLRAVAFLVLALAARGFGPAGAIAQVVGDFNLDAQVNSADGGAMALALADPVAYQISHGLSNAQVLLIGDLNGDARVNNQDINPFLQYLASAGGGSLTTSTHPAMLYFSTSSTNPGATSPTNAAGTNP